VTTGKSRIGGGGNGEVWAASGDDGRSGAIKVLRGRQGGEGAYRLGRFKDEIGFLIAHPDFPGILPLLDSYVTDDLGERSWYVMPVAVPIRQALGDDPEPRAVVAAVAEVAGTLEALAAEGVAHRDIKPDNLFRLDDQWVIGDFGLVTYPEKDPRTEHGRRLGPTDYMAPEMRADADTAAPGPADVWALAKTLWVLLTGESLPLPGTHRPAEPAHALVERITFTFAAELDLLLERATLIDPQDRISMAGLARELRACLAEPPEVRRLASLDDLRARAAALTAARRQNLSDTQDRRARADKAWTELDQVVSDAGSELGDALTFDVRVGEGGYAASAMFGTRRSCLMPAMTPAACYFPLAKPGPMSKSLSRRPCECCVTTATRTSPRC
jgi:serine/threonine protein kinase